MDSIHECCAVEGKMSLKVSVITTTYNDAEHLEHVVEQVLKQYYENIEYIIIDGAS